MYVCGIFDISLVDRTQCILQGKLAHVPEDGQVIEIESRVA